MASTNNKNIKQSLALAASALLASTAQAAEQSDSGQIDNKWNVDVGYLYYTEPNYITVNTYMAMISGSLSDQDTVKLGLVFDTLTGATPTGALPGSESVTVSGVSGGSVNSGGGTGGTSPFDDTRLAVDVTWGHEWQRLIRSNVGAHVSVEGDYTSIGGSFSMEKDSADRTYTYTAGLGITADTVGRSNEQTPEPLTESSVGQMNSSGHKNSFDTLFGISKVINRRTVAMANFSYSKSLGYHTDPYKVISIADSTDDELTTVYEHRPDSRERFIIYSKLKHEIPKSGDHISLSYRYHHDSWQLNSHTFEGSYRFEIENKHAIEPFARLYHQQAADFYMRTINYAGNVTFNEVNLPSHASSDIRLAQMLTTTIGAKFQYKTSARGSVDFRLAYYYRQYEDATISNDDALFFVVDLGKSFD